LQNYGSPLGSIRLVLLGILLACWLQDLIDPGSLAAADPPAKEQTVDFLRDVRPILAARCFACHGPDEDNREAGLALHDPALATSTLESGMVAIVPGNVARSELIARVTSLDDDLRMPPADTGQRLTAAEVSVLERWIRAGAPYAKHWSFVPPRRPSLPAVKDRAWCRNPIDVFVLARLEAAGLKPAPEADRYRLLRRLSLDLTGLPPTLRETEAFVHDVRPEAYQEQVDRLLASPSYGEHWARKWLDLARYADSQGYAQDEPRTIWRYRDWVIEAFNRDLPYDQFTIEQLAGDLLPAPTLDQLLATAFHRNTMTNTEGGTDDEEFRHAAVVDRINTTIQVWMGLTMGCAQCHSHKYDPISHEDYYRVFALFNQTEDNDQPDNRPTIPSPTAEQSRRLEELKRQIAAVLAEKDTNEKKTARNDAAEKDTAEKNAAEKNAAVKDTAEKNAAVPANALDSRMKLLRQQLEQLEKQVPSTPILRELPADRRRENHLFIRGSYLNPGKLVRPGVLSAFGSLPAGTEPNRLAFAHWLLADENPLTARVAVNRHWEQLFGRGLVETSEDFGSQGTPPSHPGLLDWLAIDFRAQGWSMKRLAKRIVMSATYRQSSRSTPKKRAQDSANRLLSRGARFRLTAEQIRDQALAVSGLLSSKRLGPSVHPPQPKIGLGAAFGSTLDWEPSQGEDRTRRGIYTMLRRVAPYPSMIALDGANRSVCTIRRIRTNTPVGALVTLDDPVFVEAAQALARKILVSASDPTWIEVRGEQPPGPDSPASMAAYGFRRVLARPPTPPELQRLVGLFKVQRQHYRNDTQAATQLATDPLGPLPAGMDAADAAGWTVVANVLLNLDETLTKN